MKNLLNTIMATNTTQIDIKQLEKTLIKEYNQEPEAKFIQKKSFAPSMIGNSQGACGRYWWYAFKGTNSYKKHNMRGTSALQNGSDRHKRLQDLLKNAGLLIDEEIRIESKEPPINGYADALIEFNDKDIVVEIKTINEKGFLNLSTGGPLSHHLIQILVYMYILDKKIGLLWYENKNNGDWHWVQVPLNIKNEKYVKSVLQWLLDVKSLIDNNTMPRRQFNKSTPTCKYCPFLQTCWEVKKDEGVITLQEFPML